MDIGITIHVSSISAVSEVAMVKHFDLPNWSLTFFSLISDSTIVGLHTGYLPATDLD